MEHATALAKAIEPDSFQGVSDLSAKLLTYATDVQSLATPDAVLDGLHKITSPALKLNLLGAGRLPLKVCDWDALQLGTTVFLHKSAPSGWWEEWLQRAPNHNPAGYFLARMALAPVTRSEMLRRLAPIGADRWEFELAMKFGMRDEFICPVGGRWLVMFWSARVLTKVLTEPLRITIFAAASFAAMRLEQLLDTRAERDGAYTRLTPRELAAIRLLSFGHSTQEIAKLLGLGKETVRTHLKNVKAKLGAQSQAQAVAQAMRQRLVI
ncbi:MAG: LuxR C-terminal-related transcriptional regulator [Rhodomicrobium sp.]